MIHNWLSKKRKLSDKISMTLRHIIGINILVRVKRTVSVSKMVLIK